VGLAKISSYLSYSVTIPAQPLQNLSKNVKVGVTLSRIPIGVYARMVDIDSEAYCAGVVPGSILIDINGMGVLGEPSHKLLERLWLYEGQFTKFNNKSQAEHNDENGHDENKVSGHVGQQGGEADDGLSGPISMKFIKDGSIYSVVFLSRSVFGISWGPCANFALVQRTYSFAQKAGVRRGCIVGAVNGKSLRDMDHLDTAMELKEQFSKGKDITITCVYTPAASRTGYHERLAQSSDGSCQRANGKTTVGETTIIDGVRIRRVIMSPKKTMAENPQEYGGGSFFTCGGGSNYYTTPASHKVSQDSNKSDQNIVSEIANRVAAGEMAAPTGRKGGILSTLSANADTVNRQTPNTKKLESKKKEITSLVSMLHTKYCNCPVMEGSDLLARWNSLDAIVFCLRMHAAEYNEDYFYGMGGIIGCAGDVNNKLSLHLLNCQENDDKLEAITLHSRDANICIIKAIGEKTHVANDIFRLYLLQLVALVASEDLYRDIIAEATIISDESDASKEPKDKETNERETVQIAANAAKEAERLSEQIMDSIVNVAIHDDQLCQDLHFLLRSFSATLVKFEEGNETAFSPVKILAASHIQLRNTLLERDFKSEDGFEDMQRIKSLKLSPTPDGSDDAMDDYGTFDSYPVQTTSIQPSYSKDTCESVHKESEEQKTEKKGVGKKIVKLFRSKGSRKSVKEGAFEESLSGTVSADTGSPKRSPSKISLRRKLGPTKLNSILRRGHGDQDPTNPTGANENETANFTLGNIPSTAVLFENMGWFLSKLDHLCVNIERSLLKSFSQKITEWALQPWSDSKDKALIEGTVNMRNGLNMINLDGTADDSLIRTWSPIINPVDSRELLLSVVPEESHILPSAKFPLLLTFNTGCRKDSYIGNVGSSDTLNSEIPAERIGIDTLYRTRIEVVSIRGETNNNFSGDSTVKKNDDAYVVHAAIAGAIEETGRR